MPPQHEHIDMTVDVDEAMNDCYNRLVLTTVLSILFSSTFHIAAFILSRSNEIYLRSPSSNSLGACQVSTLFASAKRDNQDDENLERDIDAFLGGEYDRPFAPDAPTPHPGLSPRATIEAVLSSLREPNKPEPSHGAAVLQRFCAPLSRGERWGGGSVQNDPWKEVLRYAYCSREWWCVTMSLIMCCTGHSISLQWCHYTNHVAAKTTSFRLFRLVGLYKSRCDGWICHGKGWSSFDFVCECCTLFWSGHGTMPSAIHATSVWRRLAY